MAVTASRARRRHRGAFLGVLLPLLLGLLCMCGPVQASAGHLAQSPRCAAWQEPHRSEEYIVQLAFYGDLPAQEARVGSLLGAIPMRSALGIEILPRESAMPDVPTDFVVVSLYACGGKSTHQCLVADDAIFALETSRHSRKFIKRIHRNKQYTSVELLSHSPAALRPRTRQQLSGNVGSTTKSSPRTKRRPPPQLVDELRVSELWERGFKGQGVKVAIFDTGLSNSRFQNVKQRINWTNEKKTRDLVGHGTFVASVIGGSDSGCPGLAPEAELYVFRTFTSDQLSFTAWFLDAFNYALHLRINVLNLSTGGPDFQDLPFIEKIQELAANGVIIVSAVGNNGPKYGTTTNPADQMEVIGVGGVDREGNVASFSSRGMTMWELPFGTGRVKPDLVALAEDIPGAEISRGCRLLSGTSVAAPIVSGAIAVLASIIPDADARWTLLNPASVKHILIRSADRLPSRIVKDEFTVQNHIFEQGAGQLNITAASELVLKLWKKYQQFEQSADPMTSFNQTASAFPASIDATDCPYMWPLCSQPLYHTSLPMMVNLTLVNPSSVSATLDGLPRWVPDDDSGNHLSVAIATPDMLWPYYGSIGVFVEVKENGAKFKGTARGSLHFAVRSELGFVDNVVVPLRIPVVPTPPKDKRILWDQFHNLPYPSAFVPRDSLENQDDPLDSAGDHPHTNFHQLWNFVISQGYYLEILPFEYSCVDLTRYGSVLIVDPEEAFFQEEITALQKAIKYDNVSLLVFADWYDDRVLDTMTMYDTSTLSHWLPVTGGANLPALNGLLREFNIEFAHEVRSNASVSLLSPTAFPYWSGSFLTKFPVGGSIAYIDSIDRSGTILNRSSSLPGGPAISEDQLPRERVPVLGLYDVPSRNGGRIAVFGDSSCLDPSVHPTTDSGGFAHCFTMLGKMLAFTNEGHRPSSSQLELLLTEFEHKQEPRTEPASLTPPPTPNLELRSVPDPDEEDEAAMTNTPAPFVGINASSLSSSVRPVLLAKHSKVVRAMQQKPVRQSFCNFHRKEQCQEIDLTRVTHQVVE